MNDERRCLVIDAQPAVRLGVRGLLDDRYEVEEAENGDDALRADQLLNDFDVAIVELGPANGARTRSPGIAGDPRAAQGAPGLGIVAHGDPARAPRGQRGDRGRRHRLRRQVLAGRRADAGGRRGRRVETFVDPAARESERRPRPDPPPAPDPAALADGLSTADGRQAPRASAPRPSAPTPRPCSRGSRHATARTPSRSASAARSSSKQLGRGPPRTPGRGSPTRSPRRSRGPLGLRARAEDVARVSC